MTEWIPEGVRIIPAIFIFVTMGFWLYFMVKGRILHLWVAGAWLALLLGAEVAHREDVALYARIAALEAQQGSRQ